MICYKISNLMFLNKKVQEQIIETIKFYYNYNFFQVYVKTINFEWL